MSGVVRERQDGLAAFAGRLGRAVPHRRRRQRLWAEVASEKCPIGRQRSSISWRVPRMVAIAGDKDLG